MLLQIIAFLGNFFYKEQGNFTKRNSCNMISFICRFYLFINLKLYHFQEVSNYLLNQMTKKRVQKTLPQKISIKEQVLEKLKSLKPHKNATASQAVQCLVKQAQFYTNYLVSKHSGRQVSEDHKSRKRGHFKSIQDDTQHEQESLTRLQRQPEILAGGQLKFYQLVGLNWMISLYESGINGILADDMGLGKTIQTISMLAFLQQYKNINGKFLIIGPKVTLGNWYNEIKKWLPHKRVIKLIATKEQRQQLIDNYISTGDFDIIVTSFEGVRICLSVLKKIKWHYIVIDQAHKLKNQQSQISKVIRKLQTERKLLLTGTPLQNNLKQLWSLLNFLLPEIFDSSDLFDNWFENYDVQQGKQLSQQEIEKKNAVLIGQLHKILKPFMLRRTKLQVQKTLPPKKEIHVYVGLTDMQLKIYKSLLQSRSASEGEKRTYLNLLMQLRKVCNHPYLFPDVQDKSLPLLGEHLIFNSGKMLVLDRLLKKLYHQKGHRVLIFSQMTNLLDILQDYCVWRQYPYCRIDGSTDMTSRQQQILDFMSQSSDKFIFLLSTRAGGLGINLTSADTVIIYDSDWNPQMDLQAMDRAHRIGQKNKVNVYRLITENTVEQKIIQRQTIKLKWDSLVIQQSKTAAQKGNKNLTKEEMKDMLQFGASTIIKATKGTISDEEIDQLLLRGQTKTNELNTEIQSKLKSFQSNLVDFSMNSINIFDFMQEDERRKKQDAEAILNAMQKQVLGEMRSRRQKGKHNYFENIPEDDEQRKSTPVMKTKIYKKVELPDFQFYERKETLIELLEKELNCNNDESLTPEEQQLKERLLETGFRTWSKHDFWKFVNGCEKYGKSNYEKISQKLEKNISEIQLYSKVFWNRIEQLADKDKILRMIQNGQEKMQTQKQQQRLLQWKAERCYEMDFNLNFYCKCKSKFFTYENDKFLANEAMKYGLKNMGLIKDHLKNSSKWRFDYFFKTRTQGELSKRLASVFKVLEKQKDFEEMGFDNNKQRKKQTKARKIQQKMSIVTQNYNEENE